MGIAAKDTRELKRDINGQYPMNKLHDKITNDSFSSNWFRCGGNHDADKCHYKSSAKVGISQQHAGVRRKKPQRSTKKMKSEEASKGRSLQTVEQVDSGEEETYSLFTLARRSSIKWPPYRE